MFATHRAKTEFKHQKSPFQKLAYKRLAELLDAPEPRSGLVAALLEPKTMRSNARYSYYNEDSHSVYLGNTKKSTEAHEKLHGLQYLLSDAGPSGTVSSLKCLLIKLFPSIAYLKIETYAAAPLKSQTNKLYLTVRAVGYAAYFTGLLALAALGSLPPAISTPLDPIILGIGYYFAAVTIGVLFSKYFNNAWKRYGIDGYLATLQYNLNPFMLRKGLHELEENGIIKKGVGFTEKGKEEILKLKERIFQICALKYKDGNYQEKLHDSLFGKNENKLSSVNC